MMEFTGKICVVTGGANGIGRCIAQNFLERDAFAAVIDTDEVRGRELAEAYPGKVLFFAGDVAEQLVLEGFASQVRERFGKVDFLVNNACLSKKGICSRCSYEDFLYVQKVGVAAPYYLSLLFSDLFADGASIVNISSTRAQMSQRDTESYTAAKGGISSLTHALSVSLAGRIRVNAVNPGWIDTGLYHSGHRLDCYEPADQRQHPAGRVGNPQDIAQAVLFLCSDQAAFITGQSMIVDGGMTTQMIYHNDEGWSLNVK